MAIGTGSPEEDRLERTEALARFAADVQYYLTQSPRQLPSRYFYDELGSALFEAICRLPTYLITRSELGLLTLHGAEIMRRMAPLSTIVELGPGSGEKLRTMLESGGGVAPAHDIHLVDLSASALDLSSRVLSAVPGARVSTHRTSYETGLHEALGPAGERGRTLVLFLGSNIGNFDRPGAEAFLRGIRGSMAAGDALLLGADLVKPEADLLLAYDDPLGVTAAFNRNLLVRINRELGGDFAIERYAHRAVWNADESRIEMHLVTRSPQRVRIHASHLDFELKRHEPIWTESSYKYRPGQIVDVLEGSGFQVSAQWLDEVAPFALTLSAAG
jgi:dimethylhistidine N-methyltransferase